MPSMFCNSLQGALNTAAASPKYSINILACTAPILGIGLGFGVFAIDNMQSFAGIVRFMSEVRDELDPPFDVIEPAEMAGPVLFNSPHSGSIYPATFLAHSRLNVATLRRSEDTYVDALIAGVVGNAPRTATALS